jgi:hypothetical protein
MPTDQQRLLGVYKRDLYPEVDWREAGAEVIELRVEYIRIEENDKMHHMSVRWRGGGNGKQAGSEERKVATRLLQGGGAVSVTRGHGTETHGNNEVVTSGCAQKNGGVVSSLCDTVCNMYYGVVNLTMLQIITIHFGNVLIRVSVGDNRSGHNVSLDVVLKRVELIGINAIDVCRS